MKKSAQRILSIGILIAVLTGIENHAIAHYFDTTKIDSAQILTMEDTLKNQPISLPHQSDPDTPERKSQFDWLSNMGWMIAALALIFAIYQFLQRRKIKGDEKLVQLKVEKKFKEQEQKEYSQSAEEMYRATLAEELGSIRLLGSPDIESIQVDLDDAFVSLYISETWRSEKRFDPRDMPKQFSDDRNLSPEQVMQRAFKNNYRMLLIIGDPGSGKTTLLKYYTMCCLKDRHRQLGFSSPSMPIFLPLRELEFNNGEIEGLSDSLARWAKKHHCKISESEFYNWLHQRQTLVLLDGLDEISDLNQRKAVCEWIDATAAGLKNAYFVVTSRWTGYQKVKGIEIGFNHFRADVMDFTPEQQREFLNKWFRAVFLCQIRDENVAKDAWEKQQMERANQRAQVIIDFLTKEENKNVRQLASVPLLLQIMAIMSKERDVLIQSRAELYEAALKYLLEYRDRRKKLIAKLPAVNALRVLSHTALWMQEKLHKDEVLKEKMHKFMQPIIQTMNENLKAEDFCINLRDRAGLIADYGKTDYIFRHKSFREFLAGIQLNKEAHKIKRLKMLISHFNEDWWEESLRFFISQVDDKIFNQFFQFFFQSKVSQQLESNKQTLLLNLIREAPQKKIDALVKWLNSEKLNANQRRYVIDCLKTIGTKSAIQSIADVDKKSWDEANLHYAKDIVAEILKPKITIAEEKRIKDLFKELPPSFRNPFEDNLEYILITGGKYWYSVSKKEETVPPIYFAKYPVTNKRYRRFINFLAGKENELMARLPLDQFALKLSQFSKAIKGFDSYLEKDTKKWVDQFRSQRDEDKKFGGEDQPVVSITWYAARAYCFWLSCLELGQGDQRKLEHIDQMQLANTYRLPNEIEWESAAAGREPGGGLREYPWKKEKGEPNSNLANYGQNVGATTPVGRYPDGATPEGLMDMAGNVWEWMENWSSDSEKYRALRGGSWINDGGDLRCSARDINRPHVRYDNIGFRVVRPQSYN